MKNRNQTSSSGSKRKKRGDHKKEEEDSSHTSTERLSLETAKEILQQLEEDVMDVIDESQKKFISNHKNDPAEQRFLDDYFSDLNTWLEDDRTEMHNTLLERFGRPKPNNYLLDAPHHYRTRSTTGTGIGTSSAKMEAKQIANNDLDAFNNIPSSIIEHILCLVPIKDAVRTSILSRNWRYRWTKIPKLEFDLEGMVDENQVEEQLFADWSSERKELMRRCKQFFAVHQVLFMHQAPVLDFTFSAMEPDDDICVEIEQLITQLARRTNNTVKKFTFKITNKSYDDYSHYELPRSIFLLRNLTDLHIEGCTLGHLVPTLDGFGSLTGLFFLSGAFGISEKLLLQLLANCPLLKKLELLFDSAGINELQCINIIELFKFLPMIEDLSISQWIIKDCDYVP